MSKGPEQLRYERALDGAAPGDPRRAAGDWETAASNLRMVAVALTSKAGSAETIGEQTGPKIRTAFEKSAQGMNDKADELDRGATALREAAQTLQAAQDDRAKLKPLDDPGTYTGPSQPKTPEEVKAKAEYDTAADTYERNRRFNETLAQGHNQAMDDQNRRSTQVMKSIHGEPDPVPQPAGPGGGGAGGGGTGAPTGASGGSGWRGLGPVDGGPDGAAPTDGGPDGPGPDGPGSTPTTPLPTPGETGTPLGPTPGGTLPAPGSGGTAPAPVPTGGLGSTAGGVAGAVGGGLIAGAGGVLGGVRGGSLPMSSATSTAASGTRAIGSTSRTGAARTLGAGSTTRAAAAASTAGRATSARGGATRAGTRVGAAGQAGGRGTGSRSGAGRRGGGGVGAATGRSGRKSDRDDTLAQDHLLDDQDWLDDEGAAPQVID